MRKGPGNKGLLRRPIEHSDQDDDQGRQDDEGGDDVDGDDPLALGRDAGEV
jgi:hypothetical protein